MTNNRAGYALSQLVALVSNALTDSVVCRSNPLSWKEVISETILEIS